MRFLTIVVCVLCVFIPAAAFAQCTWSTGIYGFTSNCPVGINGNPTVAYQQVQGTNATSNTAGTPSSYGGFVLTNGVDSTLVLRTLGGGHAQIATDHSSRLLSFATGEFAERMRITSTGNVGIGSTSPITRLANTDTNVTDGQFGVTANSIAWRSNDIGYAAGITNEATPIHSNGLLLNTAPVDQYSYPLMVQTNGIGRLWVRGTGQVVIGGVPAGTQATDALVVNGAIRAGSVIGAVYQDVAEWVPAREALDAGTVVVIDPEAHNGVIASQHAYDTSVAGVVSDRPGVLLGVEEDSKIKVATTGRVKVRVDATRAPIAAGDLLVTSDTPGIAMKSEPVDVGGVRIHRPGTLVGKALEPLARGRGEILVLLSLQ